MLVYIKKCVLFLAIMTFIVYCSTSMWYYSNGTYNELTYSINKSTNLTNVSSIYHSKRTYLEISSITKSTNLSNVSSTFYSNRTNFEINSTKKSTNLINVSSTYYSNRTNFANSSINKSTNLTNVSSTLPTTTKSAYRKSMSQIFIYPTYDRLGNKLFKFAAAFGAAKKLGAQLVQDAGSENVLVKLFRLVLANEELQISTSDKTSSLIMYETRKSERNFCSINVGECCIFKADFFTNLLALAQGKK